MYSSAPVQKIVGRFKVKSIIENNPKDLWELCREKAGLDEKNFFKYFDGVDKGFAIEIGEIETFEPTEPSTLFSNFSPPQSFRYTEE
jgi:predicted transcriptional regulator